MEGHWGLDGAGSYGQMYTARPGRSRPTSRGADSITAKQLDQPAPLLQTGHTPSPVTTPPKHTSQSLQPLPIRLIEPRLDGTVHVDDGHRLLLDAHVAVVRVQHVDRDGHHDLAPARAVAGDVARELFDVGHELRLLGRGGGAAHAAAEGDGLAGDLALEGPEDERGVLRWGGCVEDVEPCLREET